MAQSFDIHKRGRCFTLVFEIGHRYGVAFTALDMALCRGPGAGSVGPDLRSRTPIADIYDSVDRTVNDQQRWPWCGSP